MSHEQLNWIWLTFFSPDANLNAISLNFEQIDLRYQCSRFPIECGGLEINMIKLIVDEITIDLKLIWVYLKQWLPNGFHSVSCEKK